MAVASSVSLVISLSLCVLIFGAMQMFKTEIAANEWRTIGGGFIGSWLFIFCLTAINNLESTLFEQGFQAQLFPDVVFSLALAMFSCSLVHRVCVTTCLLFSLLALYYLNAASNEKYATHAVAHTPSATPGKRKRH
ncbi:keratinocyte-associated protein 2-like [Watersipora subatra]|uniref:keratinocyte-associated protein 2-like n=1 Tax=Watersipora subatra TaxID=2589382 RepID=UPI00355C5CA3